jgi:hypothetical protein
MIELICFGKHLVISKLSEANRRLDSGTIPISPCEVVHDIGVLLDSEITCLKLGSCLLLPALQDPTNMPRHQPGRGILRGVVCPFYGAMCQPAVLS